MITQTSYGSSIPVVSSTGHDVVEVSIGPDRVVRKDLTVEGATSRTFETASESSKKGTRVMAKVTFNLVNSNATLNIETPYSVSAHLVLSSDALASTDNKLAVIKALLSWLCSNATDASATNVERLARGEI